ncbi:P-loop NTPase fold protein [Mycolicibacterium hippocampi]|uniref:P-loop NTPase fold protein n=1 Tax=Mycolicibacterium hippocampi TaxID=659824 RepID=UPI00351502F0
MRMILSVIILYAGALLLILRPEQIPSLKPWMLPSIALISVGLVLFISVLASTLSITQARRLRAKVEPTELAKTEIQKLRWSTKTQAAAKNQFAFKFFTMEDSDMTELSERELTHLERVAAFRAFIELYDSAMHRKVIIALDELDKLSNPEDATEVVNSIKDLMHQSGVHFVVSVSEEALAKFSLRGVPVRDAFDSTFDAVVKVPRFKVSDSNRLLEKRVVGLPPILRLYCHALSGGIPRDLIRFARLCVDTTRHAESGISTSIVVGRTLKLHTLALLDGAAVSVNDGSRDLLRALIEIRSALEAAEDEAVFKLLEHASSFLAEDEPFQRTTNAVAKALPVAVATLGTIGAYFGEKWTVGRWRAEVDRGVPEQVAERGAKCLAEAGLEAIFAIENLAALREDLGLEPIKLAVS